MIRHFSMLLAVGGLAIGLAAGSEQAAAKGPGTTGNSDVIFTTTPGSGSGNPLPSPAKK